MNFDYIFFDLDGTLTDSQEGILNSFKTLFEYYGMEIPSYETLCTFIGPPLKDTLKNQFGFDEKKASEAVDVFQAYYKCQGYAENRVYDGIPQLLSALKAAGKKLVVATSKPEVTAKKIINHFELAQYFENVCGSAEDESRSKKADVIEYAISLNKIEDKSKILMIGDRKFDVIGAKTVGLKCAGVLFGYGDEAELQQAGADFIAATPAELEKIILR